jgi:hypothetical protein
MTRTGAADALRVRLAGGFEPALPARVREHPLDTGDREVQVGDVAAGDRGEDALPSPPQGAQPCPQRFPAEGIARRALFVGPHGLIPIAPRRYLMSVSILNIGRYIEITIVPTMTPTPIIRIGSMMDVSDWMLESTSSS